MEKEEKSEGQLYCLSLTFLFKTATFQNEKIGKVHWKKRALGYKTESQKTWALLSALPRVSGAVFS